MAKKPNVIKIDEHIYIIIIHNKSVRIVKIQIKTGTKKFVFSYYHLKYYKNHK